jgi:imidazolonepropionase-like amidohydrolase
VKTLQDAGVKLLLGTDAANVIIPGFSIHRELNELVKSGLTPYEALVTGTRNVGEYLGTIDSTGTVAVGKRADLVLLTGNPLKDIRQTTRRAGVMIGGRWLPQEELARRLAALEGALSLSGE